MSLFSVSSLSAFCDSVYRHLYLKMTRILDGMFEKVANDFSLVHVTLLPQKTQCLLTHMYVYFLNPQTHKPYHRLSEYYLKKHLCDMTHANTGFSKHDYAQHLAHRFARYAYCLELIFHAYLPDMLLSLSQLDSHSSECNDIRYRFQLYEIFITFQH